MKDTKTSSEVLLFCPLNSLGQLMLWQEQELPGQWCLFPSRAALGIS